MSLKLMIRLLNTKHIKYSFAGFGEDLITN